MIDAEWTTIDDDMRAGQLALLCFCPVVSLFFSLHKSVMQVSSGVQTSLASRLVAK